MNDAPDTDGSNATAGNDRLSIGARLAAARHACELDVRVVADELKLDVGIVEALEHDDKAALPAAIFVKGYLRNYARLVGLPEDEMLRDYAESTGELPPLTVVRVKGKTPFFQLPSARLLRNIILVLLAVILLVIGLGMVFSCLTFLPLNVYNLFIGSSKIFGLKSAFHK